VLRHNLRNDLNVIHGYARWVQEQSSQFDSACAKILATVDRMTRYTEQASRIKRITDGETLVRTYDVTELIPRMLDDHPQVTDDVDLSVSLPNSAPVTANHMFESALAEVVTNAIEHNDAETPRLAIDVRTVDGANRTVEISVSDNGPGIPDEEVEPLRDGTEGPVVHLSGLGLWFVAWTIRHTGGTLRFEPNDWGGTTVRLRVSEISEHLDPIHAFVS
jgi:signal transduction histidine kinase